MAKTDVTIDSSDGTGSFSGKLPEYAMEATQQQMLKALTASLKLTKEQQASLKQSLDIAGKTADAIHENQDALRDVIDAIEKQSSGTGIFGGLRKASGLVASSFLGLGAISVGLVGGFTAATVGAMEFASGLGDQLNEMNQYGIGFQSGLIDATVNLQQLGLGVGAATRMLIDNSTAVAVAGAKRIAEESKQFARLDSTVSRLGMSFQQGAAAYAEEMEQRAELGILNNLQGLRAQQSAQQVIQSQLDASKLLGKSMKEISASVQSLVKDNTLVSSLFNSMGQEGQDALRGMFSTLTGAGISETMQNALGDIMGGIGLGDTEGAQQLLVTLQALGGEGQNAVAAIERFRNAATDGEKALAMEEIKKTIPAAMATIADMDQNTARALARSNAIYEDGLRNSRRTRQAVDKMAEEAANTELQAAQKFSLNFNNTMGTIMGLFNSTVTRIQALLGESFNPFMEALQAAKGPMDTLSDVISDVVADVLDAFKDVMGLSSDSQKLAMDFTSVGNTIRKYGTQFSEWIRSFTKTPGSDTQTGLVDRLGKMLGDAIKNIYDSTVKPLMLDLVKSVGTMFMDGVKGMLSEIILGIAAFVALQGAPLRAAIAALVPAAGAAAGGVDTVVDGGGNGNNRRRPGRSGRLGKLAGGVINVARTGGKVLGKVGGGGIFAGAVSVLDGVLSMSSLNKDQDDLKKKITALDDQIKTQTEQGIDVSELIKKREDMGKSLAESIGDEYDAVGGAMAGALGAALGGVLGSVVPGLGNLFGASIGGIAGKWIGEKAGGLLSGWFGPSASESLQGSSELDQSKLELTNELTNKINEFRQQQSHIQQALEQEQRQLVDMIPGSAQWQQLTDSIAQKSQQIQSLDKQIMNSRIQRYAALNNMAEAEAAAAMADADSKDQLAKQAEATLTDTMDATKKLTDVNKDISDASKKSAASTPEWVKNIRLGSQAMSEYTDNMEKISAPVTSPMPPLKAAGTLSEQQQEQQDEQQSRDANATSAASGSGQRSPGDDQISRLVSIMEEHMAITTEQTTLLRRMVRHTGNIVDHTA